MLITERSFFEKQNKVKHSRKPKVKKKNIERLRNNLAFHVCWIPSGKILRGKVWTSVRILMRVKKKTSEFTDWNFWPRNYIASYNRFAEKGKRKTFSKIRIHFRKTLLLWCENNFLIIFIKIFIFESNVVMQYFCIFHLIDAQGRTSFFGVIKLMQN